MRERALPNLGESSRRSQNSRTVDPDGYEGVAGPPNHRSINETFSYTLFSMHEIKLLNCFVRVFVQFLAINANVSDFDDMSHKKDDFSVGICFGLTSFLTEM